MKMEYRIGRIKEMFHEDDEYIIEIECKTCDGTETYVMPVDKVRFNRVENGDLVKLQFNVDEDGALPIYDIVQMWVEI